MPRTRQLELKFPVAGVSRRMPNTGATDGRGPYPTPWAVNVIPADPYSDRLRGGSRPGLTKLIDGSLGSVPVDGLISTQGSSPILAALANGVMSTVTGVTLAAPGGELITEGSVVLFAEDGQDILASSGTVPATAYLVSRGQTVYAIASAGVAKFALSTGVTDAVTGVYGSAPTGCTHGAMYRDRLFVSGANNLIYVSRQGNTDDWDFGDSDRGRATILQLASASDWGGTCTAMVPHDDSYLLLATAGELWVLAGDPADSGPRNVSRDVGIVSSTAWAKVGGTVYFLGQRDLYQVSVSGSDLKPVSRGAIPQELLNLDASGKTVRMVRDYEHRGLLIFVKTTTEAGSTTASWWVDLEMGGFWPLEFQAEHLPGSVCVHQGKTLIGGTDGAIRYIGGDDDDGQFIESHVLIGPLRAGADGAYGRLVSLHGVLGESSTSVTYRIVPGDSAEEAAANAKLAVESFQAGTTTYEDYVEELGTLTAGHGVVHHPRVRAPWIVIWLQAADKWAFEALYAEFAASGRWR